MNTDNLVEFRKDLGLTQEKMAEIIGVKPSTYSCYEVGISTISVVRLNIIANKYHKSLNFLSGNSRYDNIEFSEKTFTLKEIGNILKRERKNASLTQEEMAKKLNVAQPRVSEYEKGKGITILVLLEYSKIFNKSIDYLCGKADK